MEFTRREVTAAGLALGTGCLSSGSNVRYPEAAAEGEPLVDDEATLARTGGTEGAPANPAFADATRGIYEEVGWFASEYEPALRAYQQSVSKARATVARVRTRGDINENTIAVIERAIDRLLATIRDRILPHFNIAGYIEEETSRHLEVTRTFANRGDIDRAQEELDRLGTFLRNVGLETFVNRNMSRNPVRNRLLTYLRGGGPSGELFEVWDPGTGFTAYAYGGPSRLREEGPTGAFDERDRERYASLFAPAVSEERSGAVYVQARSVPSRSNQPDPLSPEKYPSNALVVQAFPDASAAKAARTALVEDGPVTVEKRARLGNATMDRIYYTAMGDVVYAFMFRTAEFLVVVAPSEVAWNERINWSAGLRRTWLWQGG
ncbi:MAG: hypothetical protein ABEH78_06995 [Haloferacaceae archaeon]